MPAMLRGHLSCFLQHLSAPMWPSRSLKEVARSSFPHHLVPGRMKNSLRIHRFRLRQHHTQLTLTTPTLPPAAGDAQRRLVLCRVFCLSRDSGVVSCQSLAVWRHSHVQHTVTPSLYMVGDTPPTPTQSRQYKASLICTVTCTPRPPPHSRVTLRLSCI
ncbi:hypothetical protein E2C01_010618 [Portunus trituberculatus]|uniref:Uncharacterized protein n=1 Tax=Portunus trituberculatus TaxID=210409 RepID=A0A5B7D8X9_PORTR|nr:hypothetical protein [Portunus trituberculatus]